MIYESYIVGGVGTSVLGEVLAGRIKQKETVILEPGGLTSSIGFIDKERKLVETAVPGDKLGINLPMVKCSQIKRGMVASMANDSPAQRAKDLDYALGIFFATQFKGTVHSGMKFYLVNNRIARLCRIEVQCLLDLKGDMIGKKEGDCFEKGEIVFLKIFAEDLLIMEDPNDFPEFSLVKLRDNCQDVALGKVYKVNYVGQSGGELEDGILETGVREVLGMVGQGQ
jgi:translation elongation factor EF-1alpha